MSFSSGTYSLYATGNPVVTNTTISSTWANNTLNDIATALSTCLLKDGTQTATASIGFAQGIDVTTGITTPSTTFALANTTATTINFAGAATTLNVGAGASSTLNANFTTAINLNTAAIVSNQTTVAVINTNATTINAFGAASVALNIGNASAAAAFAGGISIPTGKAITGAGTASLTGFASATFNGVDVTPTKGTWTATLTGCTTSPQVTVQSTIIAGVVTHSIPGISATSNNTAKTLTGMPAAYRPVGQTRGLMTLISDNGGAQALGSVIVESDGTVTLYTDAANGAWTASGTASFQRIILTYDQN